METNNTDPGITKVLRPDRGPRPIASVVPVVARISFNRAAPGVFQLMEAWAGIVGPALADVTLPRRLSQATLTIVCSGPMAMELQHSSIELIKRINQYLGAGAVRRLRFVQSLVVRTPSRAEPRPTVSMEQAASQAVAGLPEGPLRTALAALGRAVLCLSESPLGTQSRTGG
jgi:hypothetical protein